MRRIKYYLFCIGWLYKNRTWYGTRQKFKAMIKCCIKSRIEPMGSFLIQKICRRKLI